MEEDFKTIKNNNASQRQQKLRNKLFANENKFIKKIEAQRKSLIRL